MSVKHVIIGGGPVATNAVETIRQFDGGASQITLVSDEPAHSRMALPYWLSGRIPREHTHTADDAWYERLKVTPRIGVRAQSIDPQAKTVALSDGTTLPYDNLLIATGASPVGLPVPGSDLEGVQPLWTLAHTEQLLQRTAGLECPRVVLIGAGFIGFIVLNAMFKRGWKLAVVEREPHVLPRMLDDQAAGIVEKWLATKGVDVRCGTEVTEIQAADDGSRRVCLADGTSLDADVVIVATGIRPNLDLVDGTGIEVDDAILVDDRMQTSIPGIYAGGDVAQGPVLGSDRREVHAIQPTAVDHGRIAGANMAGQDVRYPGSLSMNILDVCGLQNASFGQWNLPDAEATVICNPDGFVYRKLVWDGDRIVGAIFSGRANDLGMLTDVGMVKGILQTQTAMGPWKEFLQENAFDIRRAYVATRVAEKLSAGTLLGRPAEPRQFRFGNVAPKRPVPSFHGVYVNTKPF